jgi:hypothetical protein
MMIHGYEETHAKLIKENDFLRETLNNINMEMTEILDFRRERLLNMKNVDKSELSQSQLLEFRREMLNMPLETVYYR